MFRLFKKEPGTLLKEATAKKRTGDLENAIKLLKKAYKEINKGSTIYPIDIFLRLPLYLQKAKRNDEAWREFNNLLTKGFPNQMNDQTPIPMEYSIIYDKMRLFLQRESKNVLAVKYGIFSYISWTIGLHRQKRDDELKTYTSKEALRNTIKQLIKKTKKEYLLEKICTIVEEQIKHLPNVDFRELSKRIDNNFV